MGKKPTLLQLRRAYNTKQKHPISSADLARAANVPLGLCFAVEVGGFVRQEIANRVLLAFSRLIGSQISLSDVKVYTNFAF